MQHKLIGITGLARSGKDTFVKIATNSLSTYYYNPVKLAFADELKREVAELNDKFGFNIDPFTNDDAEKEKIRPLLVWWGMERRRQDPDYWIKVVDKSIHRLLPTIKSEPLFFISDVRFQNEVDYVHSKNGIVIHLTRLLIDGTPLLPPNPEESKHDPNNKKLADLHVTWNSQNLNAESAASCNELISIVSNTLNNNILKNYLNI